MCIAIIKPAGIAMPSKAILDHCFATNPDGAGYAYSDGDHFVLKKGLMTIDAFHASIGALSDEFLKERSVALHFRIGTHGSKNSPEHTHPFPISTKHEDLVALEGTPKRIAMHNGILSKWGKSTYYSNTSYYAGKTWDKALQKYVDDPKYVKPEDDGESDTQQFIREFVGVLDAELGHKSMWKKDGLQNLISREVSGSRFVIMEADGRYIYWGDWKKHEGCLYSNSGYIIPVKKEPEPKAEAQKVGNSRWFSDTASYTSGGFSDTIYVDSLHAASKKDSVDAVAPWYFLRPIKEDKVVHVKKKDGTERDFVLDLKPDRWLYYDPDYRAIYKWMPGIKAYKFWFYYMSIRTYNKPKALIEDKTTVVT